MFARIEEKVSGTAVKGTILDNLSQSFPYASNAQRKISAKLILESNDELFHILSIKSFISSVWLRKF